MMSQSTTLPIAVYSVSYETWIAAMVSSICIGFTSLVPWLFNLTFFEQDSDQKRVKGKFSAISAFPL